MEEMMQQVSSGKWRIGATPLDVSRSALLRMPQPSKMLALQRCAIIVALAVTCWLPLCVIALTLD